MVTRTVWTALMGACAPSWFGRVAVPGLDGGTPAWRSGDCGRQGSRGQAQSGRFTVPEVSLRLPSRVLAQCVQRSQRSVTITIGRGRGGIGYRAGDGRRNVGRLAEHVPRGGDRLGPFGLGAERGAPPPQRSEERRL